MVVVEAMLNNDQTATDKFKDMIIGCSHKGRHEQPCNGTVVHYIFEHNSHSVKAGKISDPILLHKMVVGTLEIKKEHS